MYRSLAIFFVVKFTLMYLIRWMLKSELKRRQNELNLQTIEA